MPTDSSPAQHDAPLSKDETRELLAAVLSAFPSQDKLRITVKLGLDLNLDVEVGGANYKEVATNFITYLESEGRTREFLSAARRDVPGNPKLREFEAKYLAARSPTPGPAHAPAALSQQLRTDLVSSLAAIPALLRTENRDALLADMPQARTLNRNPVNPRADLELLVQQLPFGALAGALERALPWARHDTTLTARLQELVTMLRGGDFRRATPLQLPVGTTPDPELLLFSGVDVRLSRGFFERGMTVGRSTGRLKVARYFDGVADGRYGYGTGWCIAPGLMITNDHVIDARDHRFEQRAKPDDYRRQAETTEVWFDYFQDGNGYVSRRAASLVAFNVELDTALVRLEPVPDERPAIPLVRVQPTLSPSHRLNIVQHPVGGNPPAGGPQRYAVRNNFFASIDPTGRMLQYVTDTEPGASGSPVLDDEWNVVALHHASVPITPRQVATLDMPAPGVTHFHNEGIAIHAILQWLQAQHADIYREIRSAQQWGP